MFLRIIEVVMGIAAVVTALTLGVSKLIEIKTTWQAKRREVQL